MPPSMAQWRRRIRIFLRVAFSAHLAGDCFLRPMQLVARMVGRQAHWQVALPLRSPAGMPPSRGGDKRYHLLINGLWLIDPLDSL